MTEKEIATAIDKLTAIAEFSTELKGTLIQLMNEKSEAPAPAETVKAVKATPVAVVATTKEPEPAPSDDDLKEIIKEYELSSYSVGDLREYLEGYEIEFDPKAKKAELVKLFAKGIADGVIEFEDDEEGEESAEEEPVVAAEEVTEKCLAAEKEVEEKIRKTWKKKLKVTAVKKFLRSYYDGDPEEDDLDSRDENQLLDMYIAIQKNLVDDDGVHHDLEDPYTRCGEEYCCGMPLQNMEDSDNLYCEICGNEYGDDEEE